MGKSFNFLLAVFILTFFQATLLLSDLIIFDLKTAHWTQPAVTGPIPKGRARHASVLHDDKLFIIGGITGHNNYVLDDICYLDLKTFTWSRAWRFVGRFDHQAFIWGDRMWVFGGLSEDAEKVGDIYWLDLKGSPAFDSAPLFGTLDRRASSMRSSAGSLSRQTYTMAPPPAVGSTGYAANSSSAQVNPPSFLLTSSPPVAPGAISNLFLAQTSLLRALECIFTFTHPALFSTLSVRRPQSLLAIAHYLLWTWILYAGRSLLKDVTSFDQVTDGITAP
jgi:hypothetical protein